MSLLDCVLKDGAGREGPILEYRKEGRRDRAEREGKVVRNVVKSIPQINSEKCIMAGQKSKTF